MGILYKSDGMQWDIDEIPKCYYCSNIAKFETAHSGIIICNRGRCHSKYIRKENSRITCKKIKWAVGA